MSFSWKDYRDLIQTAHQQLGGPIVLVWDKSQHPPDGRHSPYIADRDWLTVFQLPSYAADLNRSKVSGPSLDAPPQPTVPSPPPTS